MPSVSELVLGIGYTFRNFYYAVAYISWKPATEKKEVCADAGYTIIMADRTFVPLDINI